MASGSIAFYWNLQTHWRKLGCTIENEPLGTDRATAFERAGFLNARLEEWKATRSGETLPERRTPVGSVAWLFRCYRTSLSYQNKVSERSRPDYERVMLEIEDCATTDGRTVGSLRVDSITPKAADKIYRRIVARARERTAAGLEEIGRLRQGEKAVTIAKRAWTVVHRLHPEFFATGVWNPWDGVALAKRRKRIKPMVTREEVYRFAHGAVALGRPEAAAAAVICFEWLQRPENVLAGYVQWANYRSATRPKQIRIEHHKTGAIVWHWLEDPETGERWYEDAEAILAQVPRRGISMVLKEAPDGSVEPYTPNQFGNIVRTLRRKIPGVPPHFTLDACRHGGMTELEEAGLTEGQGMALSGHRSRRAYQGYAKATEKRALEATRERFKQ
jgi:hypothetical protein